MTLLTRPSHTRPLSGLTSVTHLLAKHTHWMIPGIRTDHSRPNPTGLERPRPSCAHRLRTIPKLETNHSRPIPHAQEKLNHTGPSSVWDAVTSLSPRGMHRNRMMLVMQTIHSRPRPTARERPNHTGPSLLLHLVPSFPRVRPAPAPRGTEGGDRSPLARPDLSGDPGGVTDPDRTVSHYVNQITDFEFDDYTEGTFPF